MSFFLQSLAPSGGASRDYGGQQSPLGGSKLKVIEERDTAEEAQRREMALQAMSRHLAASPYNNPTSRQAAPPPPPEIPMEVEIEVLRREREILLHRIGELEQGDQAAAAAAAAAAAKEETPPPPAAGIIHSVNIRTNNSAINQSSPIKELVSSSRRSSRSQSDLDAVQNIEVKQQRQKAASQDHLGPSQRPSSKQSSVSVVNLSSPTRSSSPYDGLGLQRSRTNSFGQGQAPPQQYPRSSKAALLLPGRMAASKKAASGGLNRLHLQEDQGHKGLKSRSVEHLAGHAVPTLGLKAANSEVALIQKVQPKPRLKGTHSELNVSRIGVTEKLRVVGLNPMLGAPSASAQSIDGAGLANASMPVDLSQTAGSGHAVVGGLLSKAASVPIKPNREKIRAVLAMSNVIELQRHLLTTVMENEVCFDSHLQAFTKVHIVDLLQLLRGEYLDYLVPANHGHFC